MLQWIAILLTSVSLVTAAAQDPADLFRKAPPEVDDALRQRVTAFYQAHVDGKFRAADQFVAEDSKDAFFEAPKRRYLNCLLYTSDAADE